MGLPAPLHIVTADENRATAEALAVAVRRALGTTPQPAGRRAVVTPVVSAPCASLHAALPDPGVQGWAVVHGGLGAEQVMDLWGIGCRAVLGSASHPGMVRQVISVVAAGGFFLDPFLVPGVADVAGLAPGSMGRISPQEHRVLWRAAAGMTIAEIAGELGVSQATAKWHLRNLERKS